MRDVLQTLDILLNEAGIPEANVYGEVLPLSRLRALLTQFAELKELVSRYKGAIKYPGDTERHIGTSVATQLVHAQYMREKAEARVAELEAPPTVPKPWVVSKTAVLGWVLAKPLDASEEIYTLVALVDHSGHLRVLHGSVPLNAVDPLLYAARTDKYPPHEGYEHVERK